MLPINKNQLSQEEIKEAKESSNENFTKSKLTESRGDTLSIYSNFINLSNIQNNNGIRLSETSQQSNRSISQNNKIQLKKYKVKILQKPQPQRPETTSENISIQLIK